MGSILVALATLPAIAWLLMTAPGPKNRTRDGKRPEVLEMATPEQNLNRATRAGIGAALAFGSGSLLERDLEQGGLTTAQSWAIWSASLACGVIMACLFALAMASLFAAKWRREEIAAQAESEIRRKACEAVLAKMAKVRECVDADQAQRAGARD